MRSSVPVSFASVPSTTCHAGGTAADLYPRHPLVVRPLNSGRQPAAICSAVRAVGASLVCTVPLCVAAQAAAATRQIAVNPGRTAPTAALWLIVPFLVKEFASDRPPVAVVASQILIGF